MSDFKEMFGTSKPVIGMVHIGALPGSPLYDGDAGPEGLLEGARADLAALQAAGFDAVMFGNENDRPYEFDVDRASTATMAWIIGALKSDLRTPFGVNVLWDPMSSIALAAATGATPGRTAIAIAAAARAAAAPGAAIGFGRLVAISTIIVPGHCPSFWSHQLTGFLFAWCLFAS